MSSDWPSPDRLPPQMGTSAALLVALEEAASGDTRRLATLDRLRQACDHLVAARHHLSLRDIETHCRSAFNAGPRAQTISNDKGLHAYVEARRSDIVNTEQRKPAGTIGQAVEEIIDSDLRARMRVLVEEYRLLRDRYSILTRGLARLYPPLDLDVVLLGRHRIVGASNVGQSARVTVAEVEALQQLVAVLRDSERLGRLGLESDHGDIVGRGMKETLIEDAQLRLLEALIRTLTKEHNVD
ncbi:MAG: hypothetical protein QOF70_2529 [Acetobacteraceae bacterium]|jgi:hypothetical protein|nr:hypothetical protein [Acetobacteraceae bacterium]